MTPVTTHHDDPVALDRLADDGCPHGPAAPGPTRHPRPASPDRADPAHLFRPRVADWYAAWKAKSGWAARAPR